MTPHLNMILPVAYSNPYAPPWRLPSFEARQVNLRWTYASDILTVPAGTTIFNQIIPINGNSDFLWRELAFDKSSNSNGCIRARFKDGQGKRLSADLLATEEIEGPVVITQPWRRGTQIFVDIQNLDVTDHEVQVILKGISVFEPLGINTCMPGFEPEEYVPLYEMYSTPPLGWHDEPYEYYFEIETTANQDRRGLPLPMDSDADFYCRGIVGYKAGAGDQKFRFSDAWQNQLSSDFIIRQNEFGVAPQARPIFPEICCPKYAVLTVDVQEFLGFAAQTNFSLRGVKRFKD